MTRENGGEKKMADPGKRRDSRRLPRPLSTGSRELTDFFRKMTRCSCARTRRSRTPDDRGRSVIGDRLASADSRLLLPLILSNIEDGEHAGHRAPLDNDVATHFDLSTIKFIDDEDPSVDEELDGPNADRIRDAWVIALERGARERLQRLPALRKIQPRDIQAILHQQIEESASTSTGETPKKDITNSHITVTLADSFDLKAI